MIYMREKTTIKVSKELRDRISKFGYAGESLETAVERIIAIAEKEQEKKRKQDPCNAMLVPAIA